MVEERIIKIIESLNRIMSSYKHLVIRRTLVNIFTIILFSQVIITTLYWMFGRDISNSWLGILTIEFGAFGTMLAFYFSERKYKSTEERDIRKNKRVMENGEENNQE